MDSEALPTVTVIGRCLVGSRFIRYLMVGGVAASLNICSRIFYNFWTSYSVAIVLAHTTGMITTFLLARIYVFPESRLAAPARSAFVFVLVNVFSGLQSWAVSILLAEHVLPALGVQHFIHEIAHVIGVAVSVLTNYFGNQRWAFR